jgi:hypothetical protein
MSLKIDPLPVRAGLDAYRRQAQELLNAWQAADAGAIQIVRRTHPRFLNPDIPWRPRELSDSDLRASPFDAADAELTIARWYDFESWPRLAELVAAATGEASPVARFEARWRRSSARTPPSWPPDRPGSRISTRPCTAPRCFTTSPRTASKDIGREPRQTPLTSRGCCSRRAPRWTRSRTCTAAGARP